ncbi:hypothetical protein MRX96_049100 [Rhipicephalus microplus]
MAKRKRRGPARGDNALLSLSVGSSRPQHHHLLWSRAKRVGDTDTAPSPSTLLGRLAVGICLPCAHDWNKEQGLICSGEYRNHRYLRFFRLLLARRSLLSIPLRTFVRPAVLVHVCAWFAPLRVRRWTRVKCYR